MFKKVLPIFVLCLTLAFSNVFAVSDTDVPILLYHNIAENYNAEDNLLHITPERFKEHMQALNNAGYTSISYKDYQNYVKGLGEIPEKSIIVAFDDGYLSNYTYAFPILKEFGMKAAIFIVTGSVDNDKTVYPHFGYAQAKEMLDSGLIEIGSHTHSHRSFKDLSYEETVTELRKSKYLIEQNLGINCNLLAYPYGFDNDWTTNEAIKAGYEVVNIVGDTGTNRRSDGLYALKRLTVSGHLTPDELIALIVENRAK